MRGIAAAACAPISEAAHWLVLLAGHVLADSATGQKPLIPASLMQAVIAHERVRHAAACGAGRSAWAPANRQRSLAALVDGVRQARAAGSDMVQQLIAGVFQLLETVGVPPGAPEVRPCSRRTRSGWH